MDNYCIALLLLVLFFLYVDNENKTEGYLEWAPVGDKPSKPSKGRSVEEEVPSIKHAKPVLQDYKPIGQVPQKVTMEAPSSMVASLSSLGTQGPLSGAPTGMEDYMLLHDEVEVYDVVPADLPTAYPRVGSPDNLGRDSSFQEDETDVQLHQAYDVDDQHALLDGSQEQPSLDGPQLSQQGSKGSKGSNELEVHMIYADWCGHSQNAKGDFEKVKDDFDNTNINDHNVKVIGSEVDTPEGKKMAEKFGVGGFPTHIITKNGQVVDESPGRSHEELSAAIEKHTSS